MHRIVEKKQLADTIILLKLEAPLVVREAQPGQFVIVRLDEFAERIPLTICDADKVRGIITLIIQQLGRSTKDLCAVKAGDQIKDVLGPLGNPTEIQKFGTVAIIGGGVGTEARSGIGIYLSRFFAMLYISPDLNPMTSIRIYIAKTVNLFLVFSSILYLRIITIV